MKSSGEVRYENYNGGKGKGLKNKRTKKREAIRRILREERMLVEKKKQNKIYKARNPKKTYGFSNDDE